MPHSAAQGPDEQGFTFFTNYDSAKGQHLAANPFAAMTFFWPALERQVRIEGRVVKVTPEESDAYFQVRPLGSRLGAWASPQ
ncbi:pyridoxamine 5'-phosphate oxidase family protein, partial [Pseudomonas sp.]|uniref:pyridoxamine 5'-phosphate oxidase family protein n=1 Tax=Pseudomonas sp. TaxID=306 RepID=UPI0038621186